jgi:hydroxypyruvate reductase
MKPPNEEMTMTRGIAAWDLGVLAVDAGKLVEQAVSVAEQNLRIGDLNFDLNEVDRVRVVGAGKAGRAMAAGLQRALGIDVRLDKRVSGWVNVPAGNRSDLVPLLPTGLPTIWPFVARPVGANLPTEDCYGGTLLIEDLVERAGPRELCVGLISGGGSALLCHPAAGVRLQDIIQLTSWLSKKGASIRELNTVRKHVSQVKGGRLAERFTGMHLASLIVSDVLGDDLGVVASGPTVEDLTTVADAMEVLTKFDPKWKRVPRRIQAHLKKPSSPRCSFPENVSNHLIGNIKVAVEAAAKCLTEDGFDCSIEIQRDEFEQAELAGRRMAEWILHRKDATQPLALVSGGEPVVNVGSTRGLGGRNQHLVLAGLVELLKVELGDRCNFALLSGGTDGEDGATDVAGAMIDSRTLRLCRKRRLDPTAFLKRCDSHGFFSRNFAGSLIRHSQATSTNVGDLRIVLVSPNRT